MAQKESWEKEYQTKKLVTGWAEPQKDVLRYFKYLKKQGFELTGKRVLDLGSGTGRNTNHLASLGNDAVGIEISPTAVKISRERAKESGLNSTFIQGSFGEKLPFEDNRFDLILDITSSNSLNSSEREIYLKETSRVLKAGGQFIVRALSKEGDKNAKSLIQNSPGPDEDTYYMKDLDLFEKVFTTETFKKTYGKHFKINLLLKKTGYATVAGRKFKRNYLIGYLEKV